MVLDQFQLCGVELWRGGLGGAYLLPLFTLLFRRNELLHASCQVVQPGARP